MRNSRRPGRRPIARIPPGLRGKTVVIIAVTIVAVAISVVVVSQVFFGRSIDRIESNEAETAVRRAWALVEDDMEQLDVIVRDWATWDDTWNYVAKRDRGYVASNLAFDGLLDSLKISALFILGAEGDVIYAKAKDERWLPDLEAGYRRARPSSEHGWIRIALADGDLHMASGRPILRSDGSGERRGVFVMTRRVDEPLLSRYSRLSGLSVRIQMRADAARGARPSYAQTAAPRGAPPAAVEVALERRAIEASMPIPLAPGEGEAEIRVSMERNLDRYGGIPLSRFIAAVVTSIALVGMVSIALFEAAVLGRMRRMSAELERVAGGREPDLRLTETGSDELSKLVRTMNATLDALYSMIGERDAAIREIHHRVKNNLQVITSLVSLQAGKAGAAAGAALYDIRRRVLAISFVHEELYLDREIERVDAERLFNRLATMVSDSCEVGTGVRVAVKCGRFSLRLEQAVPIGLVACEITANSFRHAFPGGRAGSIRISAEATEGGELRLAIDDDGVGIAKEAAKGLGLSLVETLARQLLATYALERKPGGGTAFVMTVPSAAIS